MLAHGLARTDSVLGYDHRGLPRASAERANVDTGRTLDGEGENIMQHKLGSKLSSQLR